MRNKLFSLVLTAAIALSATACGSGSSGSSTTAAETKASEASTTSSETTAAAETPAASEKDTEAASENTITGKVTLGVVGSDKDFWVPAQEYLKNEGIDLEFVEFTDYTTPNSALDQGEIDLNAFQHEVYLDTEIKEHGYKIQNIGYTVMSPLNLYSAKIKSVDEIKEGDIIAVPNDTTNEGRALKVLEQAGLIKLKEGDLENPSLDDIESYNVKIDIKEMAANTIAAALPDVTAAIVNGNYAVDNGYTNDDAVYLDTGSSAKEYWNLVAAKTSDLSDKNKVALFGKVVEAFHQQGTIDVFNGEFKGAYIPVGWDEDLLKEYK